MKLLRLGLGLWEVLSSYPYTKAIEAFDYLNHSNNIYIYIYIYTH